MCLLIISYFISFVYMPCCEFSESAIFSLAALLIYIPT